MKTKLKNCENDYERLVDLAAFLIKYREDEQNLACRLMDARDQFQTLFGDADIMFLEIDLFNPIEKVKTRVEKIPIRRLIEHVEVSRVRVKTSDSPLLQGCKEFRLDFGYPVILGLLRCSHAGFHRNVGVFPVASVSR
jgi:hypothetical protein